MSSNWAYRQGPLIHIAGDGLQGSGRDVDIGDVLGHQHQRDRAGVDVDQPDVVDDLIEIASLMRNGDIVREERRDAVVDLLLFENGEDAGAYRWTDDLTLSKQLEEMGDVRRSRQHHGAFDGLSLDKRFRGGDLVRICEVWRRG